MKTGASIVTTLVALASFPLLAQQSSPTSPSDSPATQQSAPAAGAASSSASPAMTAAPTASTAPMSPITGELVSKLDSKTMKAGDNVTVQVKTSGKTAEGTEIPKGSKLVGRVLGVKASGAGENAQVVLQFDHLELKGGQNLPIHSQIQSIGAATGGAASASASGAPSAPSPSPSPDASNSPSSPSAGGAAGGAQAQSSAGGASAAGPAPGTVVAKTGKIDISTTSVPGVLLANNAPGQQDPRMAQASSILLGAKQDIQLKDGTPMVVGVSTAGGGAQ